MHPSVPNIIFLANLSTLIHSDASKIIHFYFFFPYFFFFPFLGFLLILRWEGCHPKAEGTPRPVDEGWGVERRAPFYDSHGKKE